MNGKAEGDGRGMGKDRIEALTDAIFAVAMTLPVLDIKPPVHLRSYSGSTCCSCGCATWSRDPI